MLSIIEIRNLIDFLSEFTRKKPYIPGQAQPVLIYSDRSIALSVRGRARVLPRRGGHSSAVRPCERRDLSRLRDGAQTVGPVPRLLIHLMIDRNTMAQLSKTIFLPWL